MNTATVEQSFEERIVAALTDHTISSNDLYELVEETQLAIVTAQNDATVAEKTALDPLLSPNASEARQAMEDAVFRAARLRSLLPRLKERVTEVAHHEEYLQWRAQFDPLKVKVEAAAAQLKQVYAKVTAELVPLFAEIEKIDAEVKRTLAAKPHHTKFANGDACHLRSVELTARGLKDFGIHDFKIMDIKLPDWQHPTKSLWPPDRQLDYSHTVPVFKHPGDEWWKPQAADHAEAAAKAEQANADQAQADGAARETRFHNLSDWGMKEVG
jgi:hypothetical protein